MKSKDDYGWLAFPAGSLRALSWHDNVPSMVVSSSRRWFGARPFMWNFHEDPVTGRRYSLYVGLTWNETRKVLRSQDRTVGVLEPVRATLVHRDAFVVVQAPDGAVEGASPVRVPAAGDEAAFIEALFQAAERPKFGPMAIAQAKADQAAPIGRLLSVAGRTVQLA